MNRRELLKQSALLTLFGNGLPGAFNNFAKNRIHIGACDWSIGKSSDPLAFDVAKQIGLEGIQVNMGTLANNLHLRNKDIQQNYRESSLRSGVKIASLALAEFNNIPYKSDPRTEEWLWDSIDTASNLDAKLILLAFFAGNDLRNDDKGKKEVIKRLKMVVSKAEKLGVILGIESYLSAGEHMDIIQRVGSKNIRVYYDFRNSADAGHDVIKEIKWLGKDIICELHMKENGPLLGKGTLDWNKIAETLLDMEYYGNGWMQIEGSLPENAGIVESYKHNLHFLKDCFHYKNKIFSG
ncbi:MAG: TIM barrel protein [Ferruginibacter sp.]